MAQIRKENQKNQINKNSINKFMKTLLQVLWARSCNALHKESRECSSNDQIQALMNQRHNHMKTMQRVASKYY